MEEAISAELRAFVSRDLRIAPDRLSPGTSLLHDLGIDGDDGGEFMGRFGVRFAVDLSRFEFDRHFGPELPFSLFLLLYWWLRPSCRPRLVPITLADLDAAIRLGRWVTPDRPPRSTF